MSADSWENPGFTFHPVVGNDRKLAVKLSFSGDDWYLENRDWTYIKEVIGAKLASYCITFASAPTKQQIHDALLPVLKSKTKLFDDSGSPTELSVNKVYIVPHASDFDPPPEKWGFR